MDDLHITIEPERIVTPTLILRSWSAEDAQGAFEIYGDRGRQGDRQATACA